MRVLFLSQYYPPETGAAPARAVHFAASLAKGGHAVTVVTGMPNHPSGVKPPAYRRKLGMREETPHARVIRCYTYASPEKSFVTRMANHISFAVTGFFGGLSAGRCDIILVSSPPLFLGATAWLLSLVKGVPFVLDVRDYWPRAAVALGQLRSRAVIWVAEGLEEFLYKRAAKIVTVTPRIVTMLIERGVPQHRTELVSNGADTDRFTPGAARPALGSEKVTALYTGTHGLIHGMDIILDAAEALKGNERIRFLMVGDGAEKDALVRKARARGLTNAHFAPSQQPDQLVETIRSADVCIATMARGDIGTSAIPVKMYDYMACAKPVLAAVAGDAKEIIDACHGGIVVPPGDARGFSDALVKLVQDERLRRELGTNGHNYVNGKYSRAALSKKMTRVLTDTVDGERAVGGGALRFRRYLGVKYVLDALIAGAALAATSPLFAAAALAIRLDSRGSVLFRQRRIGVHSHEFEIYKFRTMRTEAPNVATDIMAGSSRNYTTRVGRFLRTTSLDELPNLINVVKGDMSIVGPRPALYNQSELIDRRRRLRCDLMRPGLTGWAQINGRDSITLDEKVRLDEFYTHNCSALLDARILLRTAVAVLKYNGAA